MSRNKYKKTPDEFNQRIEELSQMAKALVSIALGVKALPKGQKANIDVTRGGQFVKKTLSRRDVLEIRNDYISQLEELPKIFRNSQGTKTVKNRTTTVGRGIATLIYVDEKLRDFIARGDFGDIDEKSIAQQLSCIHETAITTRATLSKLFGLYVKKNNLVSLASENTDLQPEEYLRNVLGVDPLLNELFGEDLDELGKAGAKVRHGFKGRKGYRETPVSRNNYGYVQFSSIIKNHSYDPEEDDLTPEQKETIKITLVKRPGQKKLSPDDSKAQQIEVTGRQPMSARQNAEIEYNLVKRAAEAVKGPKPKRRKPKKRTGKTPKKSVRKTPKRSPKKSEKPPIKTD